MEEGIHVSIAPEHLGTWLGLPITNSLLMSWVALSCVILLAILIRRRTALVPGKVQIVAETLIGGITDFASDALENKDLGRKFSPLLLALFLFILIGNWLEFIPGVESIVFHHADGP